MPIYTRTGDKGKTALLNGVRVLKSHPRVGAYGTVDELNSSIGLVRAFLKKPQFKKIDKELEAIQHDLFAIGSALSSPDAVPLDTLEKRPKDFEVLIDTLTKQLPPLKNFILPAGGKTGSLIHVTRTIARRAERDVVSGAQTEAIDTTILIYLNRLSDLLFTMARYANYIEKQRELKWIKR